MEIRNIAIIAHVDHGKTTLTDALLRQTGMSDASRSMDSDVLEKERGITIYAKNTALLYQGTKINIVDTPGHADFGSEVERVLRAIDAVLLVVDAQEGPMPQTRYVLKKSLALGLKPIVIINKIDKPAARIAMVEEMVLELFMNLGADNEQLDFPVIYSIASDGLAKKNLDDASQDLKPLLDLILEKVPPASRQTNRPFRFQPFNLAYDDFLGRMGIGRLYEGVIKKGEKVIVKSANGPSQTASISEIFTFQGFDRQAVEQAEAGDIIMLAGISNIDIGQTICQDQDQAPLKAIHVDEPNLSVNLMVNNSPLAGQDGTRVTNSQIKERLKKELEVNVGLKIDFDNPEYYQVFGRGEMHLVILFEQMRREGYEIQVSQPQVIYKEEKGQRLEPFELVTVDVPEAISGSVIKKLQSRKGVLTDMMAQEQTRIIFEIPSRGLLGYRGEFIIDTRGQGTLSTENIGFKKYVGEIKSRTVGSMVSMTAGKALGYALFNLQNRGQLYIKPNTVVYEGMIIGNTAKGDDMAVNPIKGKKLTNMRSSGNDEAINLTAPIKLTIERGLEFMTSDEYLEITPHHVRLRKKILSATARQKKKKS